MGRGGKRGALLGALLFAGVALLGCRPHRSTVVAQYFPNQVTLYVVVSDRVAKNDTGNVSAMIDALEQDLRENGSLVEVVAARSDDKPPLPRLEIQVRDSDPGDRVMRGVSHVVGGAVLDAAASGSMVVDAAIVDEQNVSHSAGHFTSSSFGALTEAEVAAGERMGHAIARRLQVR